MMNEPVIRKVNADGTDQVEEIDILTDEDLLVDQVELSVWRQDPEDGWNGIEVSLSPEEAITLANRLLDAAAEVNGIKARRELEGRQK
jgi:hypothetical protein